MTHSERKPNEKCGATKHIFIVLFSVAVHTKEQREGGLEEERQQCYKVPKKKKKRRQRVLT